MTDTGSDVTIISAHKWPSFWPTTLAGSAVAGIGRPTQSDSSDNLVLIKKHEGQTATIRPYIIAKYLNLWGRNDLSAWGVQVGTDF
ncbi:hypothetical protein Nmel_014151 [Mimus melanotis]